MANAKESSQYPIQAGVPQGAVWSPMLFNLYVRQLPADDSTLLKVVPSREAHKLAAEEINSDLNAIVVGERGGILNLNLPNRVLYVSH